MSLPKWIEEMGPDIWKHDAKLQEALSIAWEALDWIDCLTMHPNTQNRCREAMLRIEEIGK